MDAPFFFFGLFVSAAIDGLQARASPARIELRTSAMKAHSTNHWITGEVLDVYSFKH